jgi:hypothetical protein
MNPHPARTLAAKRGADRGGQGGIPLIVSP